MKDILFNKNYMLDLKKYKGCLISVKALDNTYKGYLVAIDKHNNIILKDTTDKYEKEWGSIYLRGSYVISTYLVRNLK